METTKPYLNRKEAALFLGISEPTIYRSLQNRGSDLRNAVVVFNKRKMFQVSVLEDLKRKTLNK